MYVNYSHVIRRFFVLLCFLKKILKKIHSHANTNSQPAEILPYAKLPSWKILRKNIESMPSKSETLAMGLQPHFFFLKEQI